MIAIPILIVIRIYIEQTKLLQNGARNTEYGLEERLHRGYIDLNTDNETKLEEVFIVNNDNKDEIENYKAKNTLLKREKIYMKQVTTAVKAKTCIQTAQDVDNNRDASSSTLGVVSTSSPASVSFTPRAISPGSSNPGPVSMAPLFLLPLSPPLIFSFLVFF